VLNSLSPILFQEFFSVTIWGLVPGLAQNPSTHQMIEVCHRLGALCRSNVSGIDCAMTAMDVQGTVIYGSASSCT
jgi:hypothetical protein